MNEDFCLSDKRVLNLEYEGQDYIMSEDVKEYIKKLKEILKKYECEYCCIENLMEIEIDKLAGKELI